MTAVWIDPAHTSNGCALRGSSLVACRPFKGPTCSLLSPPGQQCDWVRQPALFTDPEFSFSSRAFGGGPTCYLEPCVPRCSLRVGHAGLESACLLLPRAVRCANLSVFQDGMSLGPLLPCQDFMCKTEFGQVYRR